MNSQKGLGLPEVCIALLLASFITMALVHHYLSIKQQYCLLQKHIEQAIELQLVSELVRKSSRLAGFTPCLSVDHLIAMDERHEPKKLASIEKYKSSLKINRMSEYFNTLLETSDLHHLKLSVEQRFHEGQSIIIADCYHAEVHKINRIYFSGEEQGIVLDKNMVFSYHPPVYVGAWIEETYFIHEKNLAEGTLYYHRQHAEELSRLIHSIMVRIKTYKKGRLIHIMLGLDDNKSLEIDTRLRVG